MVLLLCFLYLFCLVFSQLLDLWFDMSLIWEGSDHHCFNYFFCYSFLLLLPQLGMLQLLKLFHNSWMFCSDFFHFSLYIPGWEVSIVLPSRSQIFFIGHVESTAAAESLQSYPTLWDPIDGSPPGSPVPGILQARTLEWVVISFSNAWKWKVKVKSLSLFHS